MQELIDRVRAASGLDEERAERAVGIILSAAVVAGLPQAGPLWLTMLVWLALWLLYLSIVNIGQQFYGFGWESILLEAGFFAIFLGNAPTLPPFPVLLLFRWLAIRVELGAGLIKLRGDSCWRDLTCMDYHHETQPIPNPLSRYFHLLPCALHRAEVVGNFVAQLGAPLLLFFPQPIAGIGALLMLATQAYLVLSGNYAWLNVLTMVVAALLRAEPLTARKTSGVLIATAGVALALATGLGTAPSGAWRGDLLMVGGTLAMAFYNVWSRPFIARSSPLGFVTACMGFGGMSDGGGFR